MEKFSKETCKYFIDGSVVACGDAFELLKKVDDSSVRLILTDPPYNISKRNEQCFRNMKNHNAGTFFGNWDEDFDTTGWLGEAVRCLMPGGSIIIFCGFKQMSFIATELEHLGLDVKLPLAMVKKNPVPRNLNRRFVSALEFAIWGVKKGKWVFNKHKHLSYETNVFYTVGQRSNHPTKKPDKVFKHLIEILSEEGDLVLDPFVGSGTTAVQCAETGRKFIAFEIDKTYYDMCNKNLDKCVWRYLDETDI